MAWVIYYDNTYAKEHLRGEVVLIVEGSEAEAVASVGAAQSLLEGEIDSETQYVDPVTKAVTDKTSLSLSLSKDTIAANGVDAAVLSGLPVPVEVIVGDQTVLGTDGSLEVTSDVPGSIPVFVVTAQNLVEGFTIYAT